MAKAKRKPKQPGSGNTAILLGLAGVAISALLLLGLILFQTDEEKQPEPTGAIRTEATAQPPGETVIVPFNNIEPTWTEFTYSGPVQLVIRGTGQASGTEYSDAFYLYTDGEGRLVSEPRTAMFDLEIDGDRAIYTLGLTENPPPFSPEHVYRVVYDVGPEARQIAFRISDSIVDDNTGEFAIEITPIGD